MGVLYKSVKLFLEQQNLLPLKRKRFRQAITRQVPTNSVASITPIPETTSPAPLKSTTSPLKLADYTLERAAFASHRSQLLRDHYGRFVVFVGNEMIGLYDSFPIAVKEARKKFGRRPIYTKHLVTDDSSR